METSVALAIPRLRLTRRSSQSRSDATVAGPSYSNTSNAHDSHADDKDVEATPRVAASAITPSSPRAFPQVDSPAMRLRAVLARVPNTSVTPQASSVNPPSSSEPESDFDLPSAPSIVARESLRELFSRALRDPGTTPYKGRPRRNSIDVSEVEDTPRIEWMEQETAKNKGKRLSMSDEETDHIPQPSESSGRSSPAATFDAPRDRLRRSNTLPPTPPPEQMVMEMSMPPSDSSEDTATILQQLGNIPPPSPPPDPASTPARTFRLSTKMQITESNLMQQDSEMQQALGDMDSFEGDSPPNGRPLSYPPPRSNEHSTTPRPLSWGSHFQSHSTHKLPIPRRPSEEIDSPSRASSQDYNDLEDDPDLRDRERRWNYPLSKSPKSPATIGRGGPGYPVSRRSSSASLQPIEDESSSRTRSVASQSDSQDRFVETEGDRNREHEQSWNRPGVAHSSSPSYSGQTPRPRTVSQSGRPDSSQSQNITSHHSNNSLSSSYSGRPSSPNGSMGSMGSSFASRSGEVPPGVVHERERNWNSPHPTWVQGPPPPRVPSPVPYQLSEETLQRRRTYSAPKSPDDAPRMWQNSDNSRPSYLRHNSRRDQSSPHASSPQPEAEAELVERENGRIPEYRYRVGFHFPPYRQPLSPIQFDKDSPLRPSRSSPRPPSCSSSTASASASTSYIPVRSPSKREETTSRTDTEQKRGHRRTITEFNEAFDQVELPEPNANPIVLSPPSQNGDIFGSDMDSPPATSTPTKSLTLPLPTTGTYSAIPPASTTTLNFNGDAQQSDMALEKPDFPPPSPPHADPTPSFLQTPPRGAQFRAKLQFGTPSPPHDLPELPGPPSSEEEDYDIVERTPVEPTYPAQGDLTAMKTPRPPGAWVQTPVPSRMSNDLFGRAQSTPPEDIETPQNKAVAAPFLSLSRASSMPTPAPPGAWMSTPGPSMRGSSTRRRSILKVRFNVEPDKASSDVEGPEVESSQSRPNGKAFDDRARDRDKTPKAMSKSKVDDFFDRPATPPSIPPLRPRRRSSIRILDAYGREIVDDDTTPQYEKPEPEPEPEPELEPELEPEPEPSAPTVQAAPLVRTTPQRRGGVRIVDAMGREIVDQPEEPRSPEPPRSRAEALARLQRVTADLAEDISEIDKSREELARDGHRLSALDEASRAARTARKKITQSLDMVKGAAPDTQKRRPLREAVMRSRLLPPVVRGYRSVWQLFNTWAFWGLVLLLQLALVMVVYRLANVRAKRAYLATYFNPYDPGLYLHVMKLDTSHPMIPSSCTVSLSAFHTWSGAAAEVWRYLVCIVGEWQRQTWNNWMSGQEQQQAPLSWPPT